MPIRKLSLKELAMIAIILDEEEENETQKKTIRRYWIHEALRKRKAEGEYWTLYRHLVNDEDIFFQYFRMTSFQFNELLRKVENDITKRNTNFREISEAEDHDLNLDAARRSRDDILDLNNQLADERYTWEVLASVFNGLDSTADLDIQLIND
ncbi:hypothetical protein NQ318_021303 [Aromia moschata]|uniref:Uncharacterized protein n=1 Tax=Aromia moschata TaxID=1265417 RepID=A0AAV8ZCL6_9CUCU|nr:hypothetical protein NQ318_021303 [Aromia moschata]